MRWIWIVLAAIVGGVFAHAIWRLQAQLHFAEFSLVGDLPAECIYATVVVAAILFGNIALKNAPIGGREWFLSNWKYPSIWIAVLFSLAFSFLLEQLTTASQPIRIALVLLFLIALTLLVAAPRFQLKRLRRFSQEATTSARSNLAVPDAWWRSDDLVEHDSHDRFEFTSVVVRLSERLNSGRDFSVFLDGPYGSGKSSLLAMARSRAGEKLGSATCTLSCWDFPTSADAIHVILDRAVASLSRCVDVTEFRHLPLQYVRTVSGNDRWVS
ncbi:MAG TPA: hypothetical protein VL132_09330, partial [Planctomycetaceae bacterium]|nr:hypothetical protein [Planctomycetaceae bacterium]